MKETILSISGKPSLYRLVNQGRGNIIVEAIDETKKRFPAGVRDRVTSLNDICMYTDADDVPLMDIFENIKKQLEGKASDINVKTASAKELADFMALALPNYDRDRVYNNDIKKLIQWYNILINNGYTDFKTEEETTDEATEAAE